MKRERWNNNLEYYMSVLGFAGYLYNNMYT